MVYNLDKDLNKTGQKKAIITAEDKKRDLYLRQKELLATLLEHGAISQAQHDKSLRDLTAKMGMQPSGQPNG